MKSRLFQTLLALATAGTIGAAVAAPPENDDQENAIVISGESGEVVGSNDEATFEDWEDDCASNGSIWYEWTVPATGYYLFETDGSTRKSDGEALDTYLVCWEYWEDQCDVFHNDFRLDGSEFAHEIVYAEAGETFLFGISTYGDVGTICLKWRPVPVSNFLDGTRLSFVWNVARATKESFSSTDAFGNTKCLVDRRIIDGEKTSGWHDDTYWCTALSEMDILVWTGWAQNAGYADVDSFADYFRGHPGLLRTKPDRFGDFPNNGTYAGSAFAWYEEEVGELPLAPGVSFSHDMLLGICGYGLARFNVVCDCTSRNWAGIGGTVSHALVCCGFEIDAAVSEQDPARLSGIYVIDPDNDQETNGGAGSAPNSISYHPVTWNAGQGRYDVANVWDGRDGYIENQCAVLYVKPGYVPTVIDVSGGGNPQPDPPPGPVQPEPPPAERVAAPVLDPPTNATFAASLTVKCTCPTAGATIRVTTDDTAVTESSAVWAGLTLTTTTVVRVRAFRDGLTASDEAKCVYTLDGSAADPGRSSRWTEPVVEVGRGDELEATAATTYTGWLHDSSGNLKGSFTMKVGKASKKTGLAKVTLTVTDLETGAKRKYSSTYNAEDGEIEGDGLEDLSLGQDGVVGKIGKLTLTGGRTANKQEAQEIDGDFKGRVFAFAFENAKGKNVRGAATFTVSFAAKGKAKVSGTLMDGTKVSVTAQLIVGDSGCALPVSFTKKGKANFGLILWFDKKKATYKEATGLTKCTLGDGQTDVNVSFVGCAATDGTLPKAKALSVDGKKVAELELAPNGKKWTVTAAKGFETAKPKLSFAAKKGTFTGSYKATEKGAAKPVTAKITGVWLGKSGGVGTAVMKVNKVVKAFPVLVK